MPRTHQVRIFRCLDELAALAKFTANWPSVIEDNVFSPSERAGRKRGQKTLFE
jgi:hypothetical protein